MSVSMVGPWNISFVSVQILVPLVTLAYLAPWFPYNGVYSSMTQRDVVSVDWITRSWNLWIVTIIRPLILAFMTFGYSQIRSMSNHVLKHSVKNEMVLLLKKLSMF